MVQALAPTLEKNCPKMTNFVHDIWYFAGIPSDIPKNGLKRVIIAGEPICLGRQPNGDFFAMRDLCPHRAAPFSAGCIKDGTVECPYHGWRFGVDDGVCKEIPSLTEDSSVDPERIKVRMFPITQTGHILWIWFSANKKFSGPPPFDPPAIPLCETKPVIDESEPLNCHVDHAAIGLVDPAHGPFVHKQWWWRTPRSAYEKSKAYAPTDRGFVMTAHSPSSNSAAYKLLGGKPVTEITFVLPGIRLEHITIGDKTVLSFTAVTPIDAEHSHIRQLFFADHRVFRFLSPVLARGVKTFLRQDRDILDHQAEGLKFDPKLMLVEDADTLSKWYHQLKKSWATSNETGEPFVNPVKAKTLRWRS